MSYVQSVDFQTPESYFLANDHYSRTLHYVMYETGLAVHYVDLYITTTTTVLVQYTLHTGAE